MPTTAGLPSYEPMLAAYHRAFAVELRTMIGELPIHEGDKVLDVACGDGAYTPWLARRVGTTGVVLAIDIAPAYLKAARAESSRTPVAARVAHVAAPIGRPPLPRDSFDLIWCAQSLYSLPDQLDSVRAMVDLARPGGTVAVLENDTIHQLVLPWPVEVELAVRAAELDAFGEEGKSSRKYYVGRRLTELFHEAGLVDTRARAFATTRQAPLGGAEREFLIAYLSDLRDRVADRLAPEMKAKLVALCDPEDGAGLVNQPDLTLTVLDHLITGVKPA